MEHRSKGFTLLELLVAIAVFLVLIALAVPGVYAFGAISPGPIPRSVICNMLLISRDWRRSIAE